MIIFCLLSQTIAAKIIIVARYARAPLPKMHFESRLVSLRAKHKSSNCAFSSNKSWPCDFQLLLPFLAAVICHKGVRGSFGLHPGVPLSAENLG